MCHGPHLGVLTPEDLGDLEAVDGKVEDAAFRARRLDPGAAAAVLEREQPERCVIAPRTGIGIGSPAPIQHPAKALVSAESPSSFTAKKINNERT